MSIKNMTFLRFRSFIVLVHVHVCVHVSYYLDVIVKACKQASNIYCMYVPSDGETNIL